ncbi:MAG: ubiquinone/menaquinone biosynthesis methyltransferase [Caldimicrobium sp.]
MKTSIDHHKNFVKEKFDRLVRRYDLVNSLASFYQDYFWRKRVSELLKEVEGPILDLCCGPYTLSLQLLKKKKRTLFALDLSMEMLSYGKRKLGPFYEYLFPVRADAERLPFKDSSFQALTIAFGLRNLPRRDVAIEEFHRVLKNGGLLLILEFSLPKNSFIKALYIPYLKYYLPLLGSLLTGDKEAYLYLAKSIQEFPPPEEIHRLLIEKGFWEIKRESLTFGVVTLYLYRKT